MSAIHHLNIDLSACERKVRFPYPLSALGEVNDAGTASWNQPPCFPDKVEIALRFSRHNRVFRQTIDGIDYESSFPHVIVKLPGARYDCDFAVRRYVFYFCYPASLLPDLKGTGLFDFPCAWDFRLTPAMDLLIREIKELRERTRECGIPEKLDLLCFQLLEDLFFQKDGHYLSSDPNRTPVEQVASFLCSHFAEDLKIGEIAKEFGMSERTLFRRWSKYFGISPTRFVMAVRLKEGARMLIEDSAPVGVIANMLRFSDSAYFALMFKRQYGLSPSQFRKAGVDGELQGKSG